MAINLSQGILPGLQVADQLRNSAVARAAQEQKSMIELGQYEQEQAQLDAEAEAFQSLGSIMSGNGRPGAGSNLLEQEDQDWGETFTSIGARLAKAGFGKRGQELIEAGIDYQKKAADIEKTGADTDAKRLEVMNTTADWVARNLGENESEFNVFRSMLKDPRNAHIRENLGEENVAILEGMEWSPELVNFFRDKAISIKDQATLALTERGHQRLEQSARDTQTYRQALLSINRGNLEERRLDRIRKEKSGGPNMGTAASASEVATTKSVVLNSVSKLKGLTIEGEVEVAFNHMIESIAGQAKAIVAQNKGVTYVEAAEQAAMEAEAAGDFDIIKASSPKWFGLATETTRTPKYERRGTSREKPLPLPEDKSKWVRGRFYERNGKIGQYGTDFE